MAKLFSITVVLLVAVVSVALLAVLLTGVFSLLPSAGSNSAGISAVAGGVSEKTLRAVWLLAVLCSLVIWRVRRRRSR